MFSRGRLACSRYIAVLVSAFLRGAAPAWTRLSATRGCAFLRRRERERESGGGGCKLLLLLLQPRCIRSRSLGLFCELGVYLIFLPNRQTSLVVG